VLPAAAARTPELSDKRLAAIQALLLDAFDREFSKHDWQHTRSVDGT
jgi:hypothetical protein